MGIRGSINTPWVPALTVFKGSWLWGAGVEPRGAPVSIFGICASEGLSSVISIKKVLGSLSLSERDDPAASEEPAGVDFSVFLLSCCSLLSFPPGRNSLGPEILRF